MDRMTEWAAELQSIAQAGLYYTDNDFERERFQRIRDIAVEMMAENTGLPAEKVRDLFCGDTGYQTPKVDTRAAIFDGDRILLVRERDGKWSMPGGWCDYNLSPAQNVIKEAKEEAGLDVAVDRLVAVQDRDRHNPPPYVYKVVKMFFLCRALGGDFTPNIETSACAYFPLDALPALSEPRLNEDQIRMCYEASRAENWEPRFD